MTAPHKPEHELPMFTKTVVETYCPRCGEGVDPFVYDECPVCGASKPWLFGHEINYEVWHAFAVNHDESRVLKRHGPVVPDRN